MRLRKFLQNICVGFIHFSCWGLWLSMEAHREEEIKVYSLCPLSPQHVPSLKFSQQLAWISIHHFYGEGEDPDREEIVALASNFSALLTQQKGFENWVRGQPRAVLVNLWHECPSRLCVSLKPLKGSPSVAHGVSY